MHQEGPVREYTDAYFTLLSTTDEREKQKQKKKMAEIFRGTQGKDLFLCGEAFCFIQREVKENLTGCVKECHSTILNAPFIRREHRADKINPLNTTDSLNSPLTQNSQNSHSKETFKEFKEFKELEPSLCEKYTGSIQQSQRNRRGVPRKEKKEIRRARDRAQVKGKKQALEKRREDRAYAEEMASAERKIRQQ